MLEENSAMETSEPVGLMDCDGRHDASTCLENLGNVAPIDSKENMENTLEQIQENPEELRHTDDPFGIYVITVEAGEDVSMRIHEFLIEGYNYVSVISASGQISKVALRNAEGGVTDYEGQLGIISLSGNYYLEDDGNSLITTASVNVTFHRVENSQVYGGTLAGALVAASSVQVVFFAFREEEFGESPVDKSFYSDYYDNDVDALSSEEAFTGDHCDQNPSDTSEDNDDRDGLSSEGMSDVNNQTVLICR